MSIQTQIDRISDSVSAALTALTEKGVTVPDGTKVDDLAALIAAIESGGGSGVTIQRVTGTCTVGSDGYGVATCGFMPDIIFIQGGMEDGTNPNSAALVLPEETRFTGGTYLPGIFLIPEDTSIYAFLEFYFRPNSTGFSVQVWGTDYSWEYAKLTNMEFDYVAIKYT